MNKLYPAALTSALLIATAPAWAQSTEPASTADYSYAIGLKMAERMQAQAATDTDTISLPDLGQAVYDYLSGSDTRMTQEEAEALLLAEQARQQAALAELAAKALAEGNDYREEFATRDGVQRTESGLLYAVVESGAADGKSPGLEDEVVVHYEGRLIDGQVFDSSYGNNQPTTFPVNGFITGWQEALMLMRPGDKWTVVIPPELAYGETGAGRGAIGPNATLEFDIHLLEVK